MQNHAAQMAEMKALQEKQRLAREKKEAEEQAAKDESGNLEDPLAEIHPDHGPAEIEEGQE